MGVEQCQLYSGDCAEPSDWTWSLNHALLLGFQHRHLNSVSRVQGYLLGHRNCYKVQSYNLGMGLPSDRPPTSTIGDLRATPWVLQQGFLPLWPGGAPDFFFHSPRAVRGLRSIATSWCTHASSLKNFFFIPFSFG